MHFMLILWLFLLVSTAAAGPKQGPTDGDGPTSDEIKSLRRSRVILVYAPMLAQDKKIDFPYVPAIVWGISKEGNVQFLPSEKYCGQSEHLANFHEYFPREAGKKIKFEGHTFTLGGKIHLIIEHTQPSFIRIPDSPAVKLSRRKVNVLGTQAIHNEKGRCRDRKNQCEQGQNTDGQEVKVKNQNPSPADPNAGQHTHTEWKSPHEESKPLIRSSFHGPTDAQIDALTIGQVILWYHERIPLPGYGPAIFLGRAKDESTPGNVKFLELSGECYEHCEQFHEYFPTVTGKSIKYGGNSFLLKGKINLEIKRSRFIRIPDADTTVKLDADPVRTLIKVATYLEHVLQHGKKPDLVEVEN